MLIRKIFVALDGSEPSSDTRIHTTDLAKSFQATFIAIHVIDPKYRHLETALLPRSGRFEEILISAKQEACQHLDNVKQNAQLV
jgi:nucleotide-binding universal stress UspA family protein